jgi:hypothetical protein
MEPRIPLQRNLRLTESDIGNPRGYVCLVYVWVYKRAWAAVLRTSMIQVSIEAMATYETMQSESMESLRKSRLAILLLFISNASLGEFIMPST